MGRGALHRCILNEGALTKDSSDRFPKTHLTLTFVVSNMCMSKQIEQKN